MKVSLRKLLVLLTLVVSAGVALPATADAGDRRSKLDKVLQEALANPPKTTRVIVTVRPGAREALERTLQAHGDVVAAEHASLDAFTATVHGDDLAALAADPSVVSVSIDAWVTSFGGRAPAARAAAPTDRLRATLGIGGSAYSGSGINVAIVDSGIDPNRDLTSSIAGFWDFTRGAGPDGLAMRAYDNYGHGTHVAGLIASDGRESGKQFMGIAPNVNLYGFKVLDKNGRGRASDVVAAILSIVDGKIHGTRDIDIINLSIGHPIFEPAATDPLVQAVEYAVRHGIIVVTAAGNVGVDSEGNVGYAGITSPGNAPSAITVGAVNTRGTDIHSDDRVAYFSSRGPSWFDAFAKPDIVAPGVALTSNAPRYATLYATYQQLKSNSGNGNTNFGTLSGTSMAAAVATGVIALALDANTPTNEPYSHSLSPNAVKALVEFTALPVKDAQGALYDALTQGTGEINAGGLIAMAAAIHTDEGHGRPWAHPIPMETTVGGETTGWAGALIWNENIVWGTNVVWSNSMLWDENIVWGTGAAFENIVWGTGATFENIVWGTVDVWAGNIVWTNRVVGVLSDANRIVWGTTAGMTEENIVWGTMDGENIVWGTMAQGSVSWGTSDGAGENIVWGTVAACDAACENIVWGTELQSSGGGGENIVWGTKRHR